MTSNDDIFSAYRKEITMRTTVVLDDELLKKAQALTGTTEKTALIREALKALIQRESAKRLARLGGTESELEAIPRRQSEPQ
jgi:Arc/MetJ family transcription regulator